MFELFNVVKAIDHLVDIDLRTNLINWSLIDALVSQRTECLESIVNLIGFIDIDSSNIEKYQEVEKYLEDKGLI